MSHLSPAPGWTPERFELLKTLWRDGKSATQIAKRLGGVTRNAVISKVHRSGLEARAQASKPARMARPAAAVAPSAPGTRKPASARTAPPSRPEGVPAPPPTPIRVDAFAPLEGSTPVPFLERAAGGCRWPVGAESLSCSLPAAPNAPYCAEHQAMAYVPSAKNRTANELARSLRRYT